MSINQSTTTAPIKPGEQWVQDVTVTDREGKQKRQIRVVEVTGQPTLSSPVNYQIIRNDAHPHRVGDTDSISASEFRRKYRRVQP